MDPTTVPSSENTVESLSRSVTSNGAPEIVIDRRASNPTLLDLLSQTTKSVSFHSAASQPPDRRVISAVDCLRYMINGSSLVKIKDSSRQYHRFFTLDEDLSALRWVPSSKKIDKARLLISQILEIRTGKCTEVLRNKEMLGNFTEDCAFSVIHGDNFSSLDLIANTSEEANIWVTGLSVLIAANKAEGLGESQRIRERWLKEVFEKADTDQKGELNVSETITLLKRLNSQVNTVRFRQRIMECEFDKSADERGRIDSTDFVNIFKETSTRPEVYFLLVRYSGRDYLTAEDLLFFLEGEQGVTGTTLKDCQDIIQKFEPSEEARKNNQLLIDGFTQFLLAENLIKSSHFKVCQDMSQPLSHYFISASHNTYLLADQLKGPSGVEGYIRALRLGGRYIKVDCWDGTGGPVVYHGNTLTSKVSLLSVLQTIRSEAFVASQFPVILHLENHCSLSQQSQVVGLLQSTLSDVLYLYREEDNVLSPSRLMGKILLTGKKLAAYFSDTGDVTDEDDTAECLNMKDVLKKIRVWQPLSDLISLPRLRFIDFQICESSQSSCDICSMSEAQAIKLCRSSPEELSTHNKQFLCHIYPNSTRIDSSNFNPIDYWRCGCQIVSMNFQTSGQMMDLYLGWFLQNGNCGYVLKPQGLRDPMTLSHSPVKEGFLGTDPLALQVKVISGQQLPRPKGASKKATAIDPYVVVQIFGVAADWAEARTKSTPSDGHCSVFNESFHFDVSVPELAMLRFVILDDEYIGDEFIGQNTIPLSCLQTGYRHITLMSNTGEPLHNATLFVHVAVTNKSEQMHVSNKTLPTASNKVLEPSTENKSQKLFLYGLRNVWGMRNRSKRMSRVSLEMQVVGIKEVDNIFKGPTLQSLQEAQQLRHDLEQAVTELCDECGLAIGSNIVQCLRVLTVRAANTAGVTGCSLGITNGIPVPNLSGDVNLHLKKVTVLFEKVLTECHYVRENADKTISKLSAYASQTVSLWNEFPVLCQAASLKGKKADKAVESFLWNVNIIRYLLDSLIAIKNESVTTLRQMENLSPAVCKLFEKERSGRTGSEQKLFTPDKINSVNCSPERKIPQSSTFLGDGGGLRSILKKNSPLPTPADPEKKAFDFNHHVTSSPAATNITTGVTAKEENQTT